jgi:phosphonate transport system substrate-binding protein
VNGESFYQSQLIVSTESTAESIADLGGQVFAFTDPMSFSGRIFPTYLLQQIGESPSTFFHRTLTTYSHDNAIRAVADGLADGAAVDSLVLDFALTRDSKLRKKIKIIYSSPQFGIPPVVVGPDVRPQLRAKLSEVLLSMHLDALGSEALQLLDIDKFVVVSEDLYDPIEDIESMVINQLSVP